MKLRVKGSSIRLRLTKSEVDKLGRGETVEEVTRFSILDSFTYRMVPWEMELFESGFEKGILSVFIPKSKIKAWVHSEQVGFEETLNNGSENGLHLLIEKDFVCLTDRKSEDETDNFPNPLQGAKC